ncbi:MAG: tetratricopeptide repeat protein, partial [Candidatus Omnitrophica bacterium]|nr:tetratricopeptide repeat protein [Candidatus Omnitrophota bacterium]
MKKDVVFVIILLCLIFCHHSVSGENNADEQEIRGLLGEAYVMTGDHESAEAEYRETLKEDPRNIDARIGLADILSWQKKYDESIDEYKKALEIEPGNLEIKRKLADVLSWDKQYRKALDLYDEILGEKEDVKVRLRKARVLGWMGEYEDSIREYEKLLEVTDNPQIALEKRAKEAYWNNRVKHAISYYKELIEKDPQNVEAMFDLSQIYSYQSMWKEAIEEYKRILDVS